MATDSKVVDNGTVVPGTWPKLFITKNGWAFAGCGEVSDCRRTFDWANAELGAAKKATKLPPGGDCIAFAVSPDGVLFCIERGYLFEMPSAPYAAIGSGADFAFGAMAAGASAIKAVEISSTLDASTGKGVTYFKIGDKEISHVRDSEAGFSETKDRTQT